MLPQQLPCDRNRQTIAAQMDADVFQCQCDIDPIIDEELGPGREAVTACASRVSVKSPLAG